MWTDERVVALRDAWANGLSGQEIARELYDKHGFKTTRSAVLGKVHRLRLEKRKTDVRPRKKPDRSHNRACKILRPKFRAEALPPPTDDLARIAALPPLDPAITINDLTALTCRYPIGDPLKPGFTYCARTAEGPWCCEHRRLVYRPAEGRAPEALAGLVQALDRRGPVFMVWAA